MLKSHMDAVETSLVHTSKIPSNSGHSLHKGTPREAFIRDFLENHFSSNIAIGSGEIIDATSLPNTQRNQFDIVLYKRNYPKLSFGANIDGFLIESVVATIEVKSTLDSAGIEQAIRAANASKSLTPSNAVSMFSGWIPPKVLNFVVAYDGPANMQTVHSWITNAHQKLGIPLPIWNSTNKLSVAGTALDGVFILHKGFVKLDNTPLSFGAAANSAGCTHVVSNSLSGNLLTFFLTLQGACDNLQSAWLNPDPYIHAVRFPNLTFL